MPARWAPLSRAAVREAWTWREDIRQQVVNTDIDGLLTAALLHHTKGWPVVGLYDTETLWLTQDAEIPLDLDRTLWVDVDMCWPGARSLSQHVVTVSAAAAGAVQGHAHTVNPNLAVGCHGGDFAVYRYKYPFGTFQWAAWIAGEPLPPNPSEQLLTGLAWMADGGFMSVNHPSWRENCLGWATHTLPGSLLEPLARTGTHNARAAVEAAATLLAGGEPKPPAWRNLQYVIAQVKGGAPPTVDPASSAGRLKIQNVIDGITTAYGWKPLALPLMPQRFTGTWHFSPTSPPPAWPRSANYGHVVSMAVTGHRKYCWTEPTNVRGLRPLRDALQ